MGYAGSGSGTLTAYGVILPSQFDQKVYNIARLKYQDLAGLNAFQKLMKRNPSNIRKT